MPEGESLTPWTSGPVSTRQKLNGGWSKINEHDARILELEGFEVVTTIVVINGVGYLAEVPMRVTDILTS